jgi:hypothetical protein
MSQSHAFSQVMQMLACCCLEFLYASRLKAFSTFISETTALLKQTCCLCLDWVKKIMIQGGTVMVLNGGPVAQRGRQEQPRKAELVQKFGPLLSLSL